MAFIPDLARYDYHPGATEAVAVGWLEAGEPFAAGSCPADVRNRLAELASEPVRLMRGYHHCQFCEAEAGPRRLLRADIRLHDAPDVARGNGEIWLSSSNGTNLAAPVLIVHCIDQHAYKPPSAFIDAVRSGLRTEGVT